MTKVIICKNPLSVDEDELFEVDKVGDFFYRHFKIWPESAKIYQDVVSDENQILLTTPEDVMSLNNLQGTVYVVIYPQGYIGISIALLAATAAIQILTRTKKSKSNQQADKKKAVETTGSPNNSISARSNSARLGQRIPDIYGTVYSMPDLLLQPYLVYENNRQVEYAYYCVGRGKYTITDVKDGETPLTRVTGARAEIYGPSTSPNSGVAEVFIGGSISHPFISAKQETVAHSQILLPPNTYSVGTYIKARFINPNIIEWDNSQDITPYLLEEEVEVDFEEHFKEADIINLGSTTVGLNGTYTIESVESTRLYLVNPGATNATWNAVGTTAFGSASISTATSRSIGPFVVDDADQIIANIVADNGLYREELGTDNEPRQVGLARGINISVQRVTTLDVPFGPIYQTDVYLVGAAASSTKLAKTGFVALGVPGRCQVKVTRFTNADLSHKGKRSDKIKWESLYVAKNITNAHFGNVTTIRTRTVATSSTEKTRKLNCKASRLIPARLGFGAWVANSVTSKMADILLAISLDTRIGNRILADIDVDQIYTVQDNVFTNFQTVKAVEFNYTFDDNNLSFEETLKIIAESSFCDVYRQGSLLKLFFEKETEISSLLFNHRNKIPGTETRTSTFGMPDDKDGIELEYFSSTDGTSQKLFLPVDQSAINPEQITKLGVTNKVQAYFHAHRLYNRLRYQNTAVEFDATQEALLLNVNERILVADNTRAQTFDGEIVNQDGLVLTLSQDFIFVTGQTYTIFLQLADSSVEAIAITPGTMQNQVVLAQNTTLPLAVDPTYYALATYEIVADSSTRKRAFLIEEKTPKDHFVTTVTAVNYDERYYEHDEDYIDEIVDIDGNLL